jgi:diaminopimelate epimerase
MIDNRNNCFDANENLVSKMCHQHLGIGADGLILIENSKGFDFKMRYFNSDGREASMCGNGGRCIVSFSRDLGIIDKVCTFDSIDGKHEARILQQTDHQSIVKISLNPVSEISKTLDGFFLNTGSPHFVQFVDVIDNLDVIAEGRKIRYHKKFPEGTNVNFAKILPNNCIQVRTYERGVENETLSCGTGVTATALASNFAGLSKGNEIKIITKGGDLKVYFCVNENHFFDIWLEGPTEHVFDGKYFKG